MKVTHDMIITNNPFMDILNCKECNGSGYFGWSVAGVWEFEFCKCNPHKLDLSGFKRSVSK